jgi:hypothetical protein|tara:strand:- start:12 stop:731 length:720 start_codon:yes stop_codon:yes gene_type:complete
MDEIQYRMMPLPSLFLMETTVPESMMGGLNNYLDNLMVDEDRKSHAGTLVGQIDRGQQLTMDHEDSRIAEFSQFLCRMGAEYITAFMGNTGQQLDGNRNVEMDELWSVHSYAGDYNPIHDHGTKTIMGVSCTTWTKIPEQILDQPTAGSESYNLYNASGASDGYICFNYGQSSIWDRERLRPTQNVVMKPEVGKLLFFPSWLQHSVYPFKGDGERRTVAANFNCFQQEIAIGEPNGESH